MTTRIVITGQIRTPGLLLRTVDDARTLIEQGVCDEVVVATWNSEVARLPWLADALAARSVELRTEPPVEVDTFRNFRRQQRLLEAAVTDCADDDVVAKIRTDWVISQTHLGQLCAAPTPAELIGQLTRITRGRIRIPWWSTRMPFHLADESMSGYAADLRSFNPRSTRLALADPHAGRYLPHLTQFFPPLRFITDHVLDHITDTQQDAAEIVEALGGPVRSAQERREYQKSGPHRYDITTMALDLPSYQRAFACYLASLDELFEIFNPTPNADQFIDRHGPWRHSVADVTRSGDPLQNPDPVCYAAEATARIALRIPHEYKVFHDAYRSFRNDLTAMTADMNEDQIQRDAEALRHRVERHRRQAANQQTTTQRPKARFTTVPQMFEHAGAELPADVWAHIAGGASGEQSLQDNETAFSRWSVLPRQLAGVTEVDTGTTFLGMTLCAPIMTSPIGGDRRLHPDGQRAIVRAVRRHGLAAVVAEASFWPLEEIAEAADGPKLMQLHAVGPVNEFLELADHARSVGYAGICITIDCPTLGWREHADQIGSPIQPIEFSGNHPDGSFARRLLSGVGSPWTWDTLAKVAADLQTPLAVKGVLTEQDAKRAVDAGAQAVIVSNHGGRQLDCVPATLHQLPAISKAVAGHAQVGVDGGCRRGTDILKAIALGADAVFVGRPVATALALAGEAGVSQTLDLLTNEFRRSMLLAGCASIREIDDAVVQRRWGR